MPMFVTSVVAFPQFVEVTTMKETSCLYCNNHGSLLEKEDLYYFSTMRQCENRTAGILTAAVSHLNC